MCLPYDESSVFFPSTRRCNTPRCPAHNYLRSESGHPGNGSAPTCAPSIHRFSRPFSAPRRCSTYPARRITVVGHKAAILVTARQQRVCLPYNGRSALPGALALQHHPCSTRNYCRSYTGHPGHCPATPNLPDALALQHHPCLTHNYRRSQSGHPDHGPVRACEPSIRLINGPFIAFRCPGDATLCPTHIYLRPQNGHPSTGPDTACSSSVADFVLGIASL